VVWPVVNAGTDTTMVRDPFLVAVRARIGSVRRLGQL
jgi:hypothetical protein